MELNPWAQAHGDERVTRSSSSGGGGDRLPYMPRPPGALTPESAVRKTSAELTLVVRQGCGRCESVKRLVHSAARRYKLKVEEVDLAGEEAAVQKAWFYDTPILLIDGRRRFSGYIAAPLLESALRSRVV